jgi:hypothetical protein
MSHKQRPTHSIALKQQEHQARKQTPAPNICCSTRTSLVFTPHLQIK